MLLLLSWNMAGMVVFMLFSGVVAAGAGLAIVCVFTGSFNAAVSFARNNLIVSLSGGSALYAVLFILSTRTIERLVRLISTLWSTPA